MSVVAKDDDDNDPNGFDFTQSEELQLLQKFLPSQAFLSIQRNVLMLQFSRTRMKQQRMNMQFLPHYPVQPVIITLSSHTLRDSVLQLMKKQAEKETEKHKNEPHALHAVQCILAAFNNNRFIACYDEILQIKQMATELSSSSSTAECSVTVKLKPKEGICKVKFKNGLYQFSVSATVTDAYPDDVLEFAVDCGKHHHDMRVIQQEMPYARALMQRLYDGIDIEQARKRVEASEIKTLSEATAAAREIVVSTDSLATIKKDVQYLQHASDLRGLKKDDKKIRRQLVRLSKKELKTMEEEQTNEETELKRAFLEANRNFISLSNLEELDRLPSQGALFHVMDYFKHSIFDLPHTKCQVCQELLLPENPRNLLAIATTTEHPFPLRVSCGHWFHYQCLDTFISEPPFAKPCAVCKGSVHHPKWQSDVKKLEREWAQKQAKKREEEDAMLLFL